MAKSCKGKTSSPRGSITRINPGKQPLTADKYRELSGQPDLSDEQAEKAAQDIQQFAKILYQIINQNKHI